MSELEGLIKAPRRQKPALMIIYGESGIGKTTFALSAPKPLVIGEDGTDNFDVYRFPQPKTFEELLAQLDQVLTKEHSFETLVLDGLSSVVEHLLYEYVCKTERVKSIEDLAYGKGYNKASQIFRTRLFPKLYDLVHVKDMHVIVISHAEQKTAFIPELQEEGMTWDLALGRALRKVLVPLFDNIFFAAKEVYAQGPATKKGFVKTMMSGRRILIGESVKGVYAKNRMNLCEPIDMSQGWPHFISVCSGIVSRQELQKTQLEKISYLIDKLPQERKDKAQAYVQELGTNPQGLNKMIQMLEQQIKSGAI